MVVVWNTAEIVNPIHTGGVLNQHTPIHFLPVFLQFSID